jgi:hypothetical protein
MRCDWRALILLFALVLAASAAPARAQNAPDAKAVWAALSQLTFDPQKVATVTNLTIERDLARLTFVNGTLGFAQPVNGRPWQAAFRGSGVLSLAPELPLERQQLQFHTGQPTLNAEFTEALFFFSDSFFDEVSGKAQLGAGDAAGVQAVFSARYKTLTRFGVVNTAGLLRSALSENVAPTAFLEVHLKTAKFGWLIFRFNRSDLEEVYVGQWDAGYRFINTWCHFPAGGRTHVQAFQDPNARDSFEIKSYQLDVQVEKDTTLTGTAEVNLVARWPGQRVLLFGLTPNLQVSSVTDGSGAPLPYFQPPDPKDDLYFSGALPVVLPAPTTEGQQLTIRFAYAGKRVIRSEGVGVYFASSFGWYPYGGGEEFTHRYDFDFTLRVPKKYDAVATGAKTDDDRIVGDYRVTHWVTDVPTAVCGFAFGQYRIHEDKLDTGTLVQVYVNPNPDKFTREIQVLTEQGESGITPGGLTGLPSGDSGSAETAAIQSINPANLGKTMLVEVGNSLKVFSAYFGPYPYKKLAVSNIPLDYGYGQGWPGLLFVSSITFLDSTQRHVLFRGLSEEDHINITDRFRAHETSHQWWGHVVGWKSYHDQWLSEGFAEFSGLLYVHAKEGLPKYLAGLRANRDPLLSKDREGAVIEQVGPIYAGFRLVSTKHPGTYSVTVYNKGGWVLHMLRMLMRDFQSQDYDRRFKALMQDFTKTYWNQAASTDDFKRIAEKHMTPWMNVDGKRNLDWFFNQWVYSTGVPRYTVSYTISPDGSGSIVRGTIKQSGVPDNFVMPMVVYGRAGQRTVPLTWAVVTGPETPFEARANVLLDKVSINEWEDVLASDVNYVKK